MSVQSSRLAAREFIAANLSQLAADVIDWRKMAVLPPNSMVHDLAKLCVGFAAAGDEYQEAERLIAQFALEQAAAPAQQGDTPERNPPVEGCKFSRDAEAYNRLLPKLAALADTIDAISDDQYGEWVNALPEDEFIEYIAVCSEEPALQKAVALARQIQA
jgi:hypothetical protein